MIRRLRAILVIALVWAGAWLPIGALLIGVHILDTSHPLLGLAVWTAWGGVSGAAFALVLAVAERRPSFTDLSLTRFITWGAVGGVVFPVAWMLLDLAATPVVWRWDYWWPALVVLAVSALLGGICAAATALLARHGSPRGGSSLTSA